MKQKERPRCRKVIEGLLKKGHTLHSIAYWSRYTDTEDGKIIYIEFDNCRTIKPADIGLETPTKLGIFSDGLKIQARKMLEESEYFETIKHKHPYQIYRKEVLK